MSKPRLNLVPIFIGGEWIESKTARTPVFNPSIGEVISECPVGNLADANAAVEAAHAAFPAWMETPPVERARILGKFKMLMEENFEDIVRSNTREHGKTLVESRGDVKRGMEVIEFALGVPSLMMGDVLENIAHAALTAKPSASFARSAASAPRRSTFPPWSRSDVSDRHRVRKHVRPQAQRKKFHSPPSRSAEAVWKKPACRKECSTSSTADAKSWTRCLRIRRLRRFSFVGSTPIARHIYETGTEARQARSESNGGREELYVRSSCSDADVENSTRGVIEAAFGCAGERCMAGSTAVIVGAAEKTVLPTLIEATRKIKVGPTDRETQPDMGAVITKQHRDRVLELIEAGVKEGAKIPADGRGVKVSEAPNGFYVGATILDHVQSGTTVAKEEIFGPVLNVMHMEDLGTAIELANKSMYGNGASIFTRSGKAAREFKHSAKAGMIGINIGVPASMAWFPFNGWDESFFGDLHMQGREGVQFFTQQKVTTSRWFSYGEGDIWHTEKK